MPRVRARISGFRKPMLLVAAVLLGAVAMGYWKMQKLQLQGQDPQPAATATDAAGVEQTRSPGPMSGGGRGGLESSDGGPSVGQLVDDYLKECRGNDLDRILSRHEKLQSLGALLEHEVLVRLSGSRDSFEQRVLLGLLKGSENPRVAEALAQLAASSSDMRVCSFAAAVLLGLEIQHVDPDLLERIFNRLRIEDPFSLPLGIALLAQRKDPSLWSPVLAILADSTSPEEWVDAAARALAEHGGAIATGPIQDLLESRLLEGETEGLFAALHRTDPGAFGIIVSKVLGSEGMTGDRLQELLRQMAAIDADRTAAFAVDLFEDPESVAFGILVQALSAQGLADSENILRVLGAFERSSSASSRMGLARLLAASSLGPGEEAARLHEAFQREQAPTVRSILGYALARTPFLDKSTGDEVLILMYSITDHALGGDTVEVDPIAAWYALRTLSVNGVDERTRSRLPSLIRFLLDRRQEAMPLRIETMTLLRDYSHDEDVVRCARTILLSQDEQPELRAQAARILAFDADTRRTQVLIDTLADIEEDWIFEIVLDATVDGLDKEATASFIQGLSVRLPEGVQRDLAIERQPLTGAEK